MLSKAVERWRKPEAKRPSSPRRLRHKSWRASVVDRRKGKGGAKERTGAGADGGGRPRIRAAWSPALARGVGSDGGTPADHVRLLWPAWRFPRLGREVRMLAACKAPARPWLPAAGQLHSRSAIACWALSRAVREAPQKRSAASGRCRQPCGRAFSRVQIAGTRRVFGRMTGGGRHSAVSGAQQTSECTVARAVGVGDPLRRAHLPRSAPSDFGLTCPTTGQASLGVDRGRPCMHACVAGASQELPESFRPVDPETAWPNRVRLRAQLGTMNTLGRPDRKCGCRPVERGLEVGGPKRRPLLGGFGCAETAGPSVETRLGPLPLLLLLACLCARA